MRFLAVLLMLLAASAHAETRSGYTDASPATRAMQEDDSANPGFLWVQQGEALWSFAPESGGKSCAACHGAPTSMRGVAARYPAFDKALGRPLTLEQRINLCRINHQSTEKLSQDSDGLLGLTALVGLQSRAMSLQVQQDGPMQAPADAGKTLFNTRLGQLNLSCHDCHDTLAGQRLAGSLIPQGHANGYPLYRLEWQSMGSLYRRIRNCLTGVRATPFPPDAPELTAIEIYLAGRAQGLLVETPAVRP